MADGAEQTGPEGMNVDPNGDGDGAPPNTEAATLAATQQGGGGNASGAGGDAPAGQEGVPGAPRPDASQDGDNTQSLEDLEAQLQRLARIVQEQKRRRDEVDNAEQTIAKLQRSKRAVSMLEKLYTQTHAQRIVSAELQRRTESSGAGTGAAGTRAQSSGGGSQADGAQRPLSQLQRMLADARTMRGGGTQGPLTEAQRPRAASDNVPPLTRAIPPAIDNLSAEKSALTDENTALKNALHMSTERHAQLTTGLTSLLHQQAPVGQQGLPGGVQAMQHDHIPDSSTGPDGGQPRAGATHGSAQALRSSTVAVMDALKTVPQLTNKTDPEEVFTWGKEIVHRYRIYLKGNGVCERLYVDIIIDNLLPRGIRDAARTVRLNTVDELVAWVSDWFGVQPDVLEHAARARIYGGKITQRFTQTVQSYYAHFMSVVTLAGITDRATILYWFKAGLLPEIADLCEADNDGKRITDLHALFTFACGKHALLQAQRARALRKMPATHRHANSRPQLGRQHFRMSPPPHMRFGAQLKEEVAKRRSDSTNAAFTPVLRKGTNSVSFSKPVSQQGHQAHHQGAGSGEAGGSGHSASWHNLSHQQMGEARPKGVCFRCLRRPGDRWDRQGVNEDGVHVRRNNGHGWICRAHMEQWPGSHNVPLPGPPRKQ